MYSFTILINYRTFFLSSLDWHNKLETNDRIKLGYCESICLLVPSGQHEFSFSFFTFAYHTDRRLLSFLSSQLYPQHLIYPLPFHFSSLSRKRQAAQGFEQNTAHQVEAAPSSSPYLKAQQNNLQWGTNFQKPAKHQGQVPISKPGAWQREQPIQLSQAYKGPRLVPWRIPNCWSKVHELL